jgi:hypothetical protein
MQTIEAAVHRWDAENAVGAAQPMATEFATDAISQNFEVMVPFRRGRKPAPRGSGETYRFRQTDGADSWTVRFEGDDVRLDNGTGTCDVELAGTASDLMLLLWQRLPATRLVSVAGDPGVLSRYFHPRPAGMITALSRERDGC